MPIEPLHILEQSLLAHPDADDLQWVFDVSAGLWKRSPISSIRYSNSRILSTSLAASVDDWEPTGISTADTLLISDSTDPSHKISGIAGGASGRTVRLLNVGRYRFALAAGDSASAAANRFDFGPYQGAVMLAPGEAALLVYDGSASRWRAVEILKNPISTYARVNYETGYTPVTFANSGAGSWGGVGSSSEGFVAYMETGTTTTGYGGVTTTDNSWLGSVFSGVIRGAFVFPDAISDGTDTYTIYIGGLDSATGVPTDGTFFRYTHGTNSGKFEAVCRANGTETAVDTGITPAASKYYSFAVHVRSSALADFYLEASQDSNALSRVCTVTTNIPGSGRSFGLGASIVKSAGTTTRFWDARPMMVEYGFGL